MNNWMLFGLFLAVPVLVHLFSFRRVQKVFFSHTQFIQRLNKREQSKSKWKHLLVLLTRFLTFLALIALFSWSREVVKDYDEGSIAVYVDKSVSSQYPGFESFSTEFLYEIQRRAGNLMLVDDFESQRLLGGELRLAEDFFEPYFTNVPVKNLVDGLKEDVVFFVSDFNTWKESDFWSVLSDTTRQYILVSAGNENLSSNVYIDTMYIHQKADEKMLKSLVVEFASNHVVSQGNLLVKLINEGRQVSSVVIDLEETNSAAFDLGVELTGSFQIVFDGDPGLFDNSFRFLIGHEQVPVIASVDKTTNQYLLNVFRNESMFDLRQFEGSNLDFQALEQVDVMVFAGLESLPRGVINQNNDFLLFIFPGVDFNPSELPFLLGYSSEPGKLEIDIDLERPMFKGIADSSLDGISMPLAKPFGTFQGNYESLISFRGGDTFLAKSGNIYFFNTVLIDSLSNLQSHSLFLPVLYQLVFDSQRINEAPYFFPGDFIFIERSPGDLPFIIKGKGFEAVPEFNVQEKGTLIQIPEQIEPGVFQIAQGGDTLKTFCINVPKSESQDGGWDYEQIQTYFKEIEHVRVFDANQIKPVQIFNEGGDKIPFWKYALLLVLAFLLIETILQRHLK